MILLLICLIVFIFSTNALNTRPVPSPQIDRTGTPRICQKTKVAVLGAGVAGITAAVRPPSLILRSLELMCISKL